MSSTKADPSGHVRALDGVRGLAILLVFLYDCLRPEAGGPINYVVRRICTAGWIGVDLFFVLSGFLITGILLDSKGKPGYFSSFFLRRSVRIFPLYYIALAFTFLVLPMWCRWSGGHPELESKLAALSGDQVWYWTYLQNWLFAFRQSWPEPDYLKHFWSLAIEEQFYLVWPFVVAAVSLRSMPALCLAMIGTSVAVRTGLYLNGYHWVTTFAPTICRLDGLAMGALAATLLRTDSWRDRVTRWSPPLAAASLVGLFALDKVWPVLANDHVGTHTIGHTLFAVVFASFIVTARTAGEKSWLARGLSTSFLVLLGQLSYGLYVFHRPIHKFVLGWNLDGLPAGVRSYAEFAATLSLSLVVAGLSWILIEKPLLGLKRYFPRPDEARNSSSPPPAPEADLVQPTSDPDYHWPVREHREPRGAEVTTSLR